MMGTRIPDYAGLFDDEFTLFRLFRAPTNLKLKKNANGMNNEGIRLRVCAVISSGKLLMFSMEKVINLYS